jgi:hypothetical protein
MRIELNDRHVETRDSHRMGQTNQGIVKKGCQEDDEGGTLGCPHHDPLDGMTVGASLMHG